MCHGSIRLGNLGTKCLTLQITLLDQPCLLLCHLQVAATIFSVTAVRLRGSAAETLAELGLEGKGLVASRLPHFASLGFLRQATGTWLILKGRLIPRLPASKRTYLVAIAPCARVRRLGRRSAMRAGNGTAKSASEAEITCSCLRG